MVEIDPYDPTAKPVKRTMLGRIKHEGATPSIGANRRIAFYTGDDQTFEYIYKFVTRDPWDPNDRAKNRDLLDHGTLYAARFDADGRGSWLALEFGNNGLTAENGFRDQAEVLVKTRQAADRAGATKMDRPEWTAVDSANPRDNNVFGHILRWREDNDDPAATGFRWDVFVECGNPAHADANKRGNIKGDMFACPDGLLIDPRGVLWVQTDISATVAIRKKDGGVIGS